MNSKTIKTLAAAAEKEEIYLFYNFPKSMNNSLEALEIELENRICEDGQDPFNLTVCQ